MPQTAHFNFIIGDGLAMSGASDRAAARAALPEFKNRE
jgi:hypothetical protein